MPDSSKPQQFSPQWWTDKEASIHWCNEFCTPFYQQDPALLHNAVVNASIGVVFYNQPDGTIVPVGFTALEGEKFIFAYHPSYLENPTLPPLSVRLPKQKERFESQHKLLPFFDNLPAEGWFGKAQGAALGGDINKIDGDSEPLADRYNRLMMFGRDCPGAVWATYIKIDPAIAEEQHQETIVAALRSRSSIAGMQPKLLGVMEDGKLRPTNYWETSTHIVKLPVDNMPKLMEYEYMSIIATKSLLPNEPVVDAALAPLHLRNGNQREVLAIKRFDRTLEGKKIHFEELNQLLGKPNAERYEGSYSQIAAFIEEKMGKEGVKRFYARLLCQFLLGNTDNHFKNFAMFPGRDGEGWELTPDYDLAPSANYRKGTLALMVKGAQFSSRTDNSKIACFGESSIEYETLSPKVLIALGQQFGLSIPEATEVIRTIIANIPNSIAAVMNDPSAQLDAHANGAAGRKSASNATCREDFCLRLEGRKNQLFGTLDKYLALVASKGVIVR